MNNHPFYKLLEVEKKIQSFENESNKKILQEFRKTIYEMYLCGYEHALIKNNIFEKM